MKCIVIQILIVLTLMSCASTSDVGNDIHAGTVSAHSNATDSLLSYFGEKSYDPGGRYFEGLEWKSNGPRIRVTVKLNAARLRNVPGGAVYRMTFAIVPVNTKYAPHEAFLYFLVRSDTAYYLLKEEAESDSDLSGLDDRSRLRCAEGSVTFAEGDWNSTIKTDPEMCVYSSETPNGNYSILKWKNDRGLVEYSFGYGGGKDGMRIRAK